LPNLKTIAKELIPPLFLKLYRKLGRPLLSKQRGEGSSAYYERYLALNRDCEWNQIVLKPGLKLTISPESRNFDYFCFRDEEMVKEFDCFLDVAQTKKNLLDVGAFYGIFSLAFTFGRSEARAVAIEPSPLAFQKLLYNQYKNPSCSIKALEMALSDQDGIIQMYFEWEFVKTMGQSTLLNEKPVRISGRTGDAVCADEGLKPDLVKIDVEGYELKCLFGLRGTLENCRPVIFLELHPTMLADYGNSPADVLRFLTAQNYAFFDSNKARMSGDEISGLTRTQRVVAAPVEKGI